MSTQGRGAQPPEIAELPRSDEVLRDGILENDHPIPPWFNWAFVATIVFAFVYVPYYAVTGWSSRGQYEAELAAAQEKAAQLAASLPQQNPFHGDAQAIAEGAQTWASVCAACHKPDGSGLVGPSLVDPYWKYGNSDVELFHSVSEGRPGGMPPWGPQLGAEKIWKVLAYLETLPRSASPGVGAPGVGTPAPGGADAGAPGT